MQVQYIKLVIDTVYPDSGYYYVGVDELRAKKSDGTNVALNKTVIASSASSDWGAAKLTDGSVTTAGGQSTTHAWGDTTSYANGAVNGAEYAIVDLDEAYNIKSIEIVSMSYPNAWMGPLKAYRLYTSTDNLNYSLAYTASNMPNTYGRVDTVTLSDGQQSQLIGGVM